MVAVCQPSTHANVKQLTIGTARPCIVQCCGCGLSWECIEIIAIIHQSRFMNSTECHASCSVFR